MIILGIVDVRICICKVEYFSKEEICVVQEVVLRSDIPETVNSAVVPYNR